MTGALARLGWRIYAAVGRLIYGRRALDDTERWIENARPVNDTLTEDMLNTVADAAAEHMSDHDRDYITRAYGRHSLTRGYDQGGVLPAEPAHREHDR